MLDNPKFKAALIGGGALGVASGLPYIGMVNQLCCALFIGGGVLAVYLFLKDDAAEENRATYGNGALVGLLAGVVGGVAVAVVGAIVMATGFSGGTADPAQVADAIAQAGIDLPPIVQEIMGLDGLTLAFFLGQMVINVVVDGLFSTIGGLLGVAIFRNKDED